MANVAQGVVRAHLAARGQPQQRAVPARLLWRLGSGGVHLHEVRVLFHTIDVDSAHSAVLPYKATPLLGRVLGGLCGRYGITAKTDTMLCTHSTHRFLQMLGADATILPPGRDATPREGTP
jgi:hypothetical protein